MGKKAYLKEKSAYIHLEPEKHRKPTRSLGRLMTFSKLGLENVSPKFSPIIEF